MKTVAIITEYNPMHNGHLSQINYIKENFGYDTKIIIIMSGNFVQRGMPACMEKYTRAKLAIENGVSLVVELPAIFSSSSAKEFATASIKLISSLGVVDHIVCGAENFKNINKFWEIAKIIKLNRDDFEDRLLKYIKLGNGYPYARELALKEIIPNESSMIHEILNNSNNILALEYIMAIIDENQIRQNNFKNALKIDFSPRIGSKENDNKIETNINASASAIREVLYEEYPYFKSNIIKKLEKHVPANVLANLININSKLQSNYNSYALSIILISEAEELSKFRDFDLDLANRLKNLLNQFLGSNKDINIEEVLFSTATRYYPLSRVKRSILARMLGLKTSDWKIIKSDGPSYINILAADKDGKYLLKLMRNLSSLPIVVKNSDLLENKYNDNISSSKLQQELNLASDALYKLISQDFSEGIFAKYIHLQ